MQFQLRKEDGLSDEDSEADEYVPLVTVFSSAEGLDKDNFEPDPVGVTPGIVMNNLSKVWHSWRRVSGFWYIDS